MCACKDLDTPVVYAITPETPFTPTSSEYTDKYEYKIGSVLKKTESRFVEYKSGGGNYPILILPSHIRKYGSAFLNSGGGKLCVGVTDDGIVTGIRLLKFEERERIRKVISNEFLRFTPAVKEDLYQVRFVPCNRHGFYVLEIDVRPGKQTEIYSDGENKMFYKRDGSVEGPLWPNRIKEIVTSKFIEGLKDEDTQLS